MAKGFFSCQPTLSAQADTSRHSLQDRLCPVFTDIGLFMFRIVKNNCTLFFIAINARLVGIARGKYGIEPPKMEGPAEFIRIMRAQYVIYIHYFRIHNTGFLTNKETNDKCMTEI